MTTNETTAAIDIDAVIAATIDGDHEMSLRDLAENVLDEASDAMASLRVVRSGAMPDADVEGHLEEVMDMAETMVKRLASMARILDGEEAAE